MKASILFSGAAAAQKFIFSVSREDLPMSLFAGGLAGAEACAVEFLPTESDASEAADAEWLGLQQGGSAVTVTATNNLVRIDQPGNYRVVAPASAAGAITIGLY